MTTTTNTTLNIGRWSVELSNLVIGEYGFRSADVVATRGTDRVEGRAASTTGGVQWRTAEWNANAETKASRSARRALTKAIKAIEAA